MKTEFPVSFVSINNADNTWRKGAELVAQPILNIVLGTYLTL
jgi:hypothetical protein